MGRRTSSKRGVLHSLARGLGHKSRPQKRMLVAQHSGLDVWERLAKDENEMVRAAVALAGDDTIHRELANDSSSLVRGYVADYSSPAVLRYMADH